MSVVASFRRLRSTVVQVQSKTVSVRGSGTPIWLRVFDSWRACTDFVSERDSGAADLSAFTSDQWVQRQAAMYMSAREGAYPRATLLPPLVKLTGEHKIYDFGGGSGWPIELLDETALEHLSKYVVVEQPQFVERLKSKLVTTPKLEFLSLSDVIEASDISDGILYANSALQYLASDDEIRSLIQRISPTWLLFDDLQVSTGQEFFSLQRYYGTFIPCRFFNLKKLCGFLEELGYLHLFSFPYPKRFAEGTIPIIEERQGRQPNIGAPLSVGFRLLNSESFREQGG